MSTLLSKVLRSQRRSAKERVEAAKTVCLGRFVQNSKQDIPYSTYRIFPMGSVEKKGGGDYRPVDDHTRTGLNEATDGW